MEENVITFKCNYIYSITFLKCHYIYQTSSHMTKTIFVDIM